MGGSLRQIAEQLRDAEKKAQLIYAFNGVGKTRLSRAFKEVVTPAPKERDENAAGGLTVLYYNAFTEDLFYWDNDFAGDDRPKLKIQDNWFTDWILGDQGQDFHIIETFQNYTSRKLTPRFNEAYTVPGSDGELMRVKAFSEVTFSLQGGDDTGSGAIKISRGEESSFIWSVFYTLLQEVVAQLEDGAPDDERLQGLRYVVIDDPVSSLDDKHLIEMAVNVAELIKRCKAGLQFIVTTHNPLFYNVMYNELSTKLRTSAAPGRTETIYKSNESLKYMLKRGMDGTYELTKQDDGAPFSYHLFLLAELRAAVASGEVRKYHFNFLRNLLEKTAAFLGYKDWFDLLPKNERYEPDGFGLRIISLSSHSDHATNEMAQVDERDASKLAELLRHVTEQYKFRDQAVRDG